MWIINMFDPQLQVGATVTWQFIRDSWAELVSARGEAA